MKLKSQSEADEWAANLGVQQWSWTGPSRGFPKAAQQLVPLRTLKTVYVENTDVTPHGERRLKRLLHEVSVYGIDTGSASE